MFNRKQTTVDLKPADVRYDDETLWVLVSFSQRDVRATNPLTDAKDLVSELARHGLYIEKKYPKKEAYPIEKE